MNINKIEEIFEKTLDEIYLFLKSDTNEPIVPTSKDYKYIEGVKEYLINMENQIKEIIPDDNIEIINIFTKLVYIYTCLYIHNKYNLIDFKNLLISNSNILKSENILKILKYSQLVDDLGFIIDNKIDIENKKIKINTDSLIHALRILNDLGFDTFGDIKELDNYHNIIKFIVYDQIYIIDDKKNVFQQIEKEELSHLEFKYIEIIETNVNIIDFSSIESVITVRDNSFTENMYDLINVYSRQKQDYNNEEKINILFEKKLLIPITDEFLRYHRDNERYDIGANIKNLNIKLGTNKPLVKIKKENTKIRYIITKIENVKDLYKGTINIEKLLFPPLIYRKAVLINDIEELVIIKKLKNLSRLQKEQHEYFNELLSYRIYPYINFKDFKNDGFQLTFNKNIDVIRYTNFEYKHNPNYNHILRNPVQWRIVSENMEANIVGVAMPYEISLLLNENDRRHDTIIQCINLNNTYDVKNMSKNGLKVMLKLLKNTILDNIKYDKLPYWIFNRKTDKIEKRNNELDTFTNEEYYKYLLELIYNELVVTTYDKIVNNIMSNDFISFENTYRMITKIQKRLLEIDDVMANKIERLIFLKKSPSYKDEYDILEDRIPGLTTELIKIPSIPEKKNTKIVINIKKDKTNNKLDDINIYEKSICQHNITWNKIERLRKKEPNKFMQEIYLFYNKYVIENNEKELICKSCSEAIDIKKFLSDWQSSTQDGISLSISLNVQLEDLPEYEKYAKSINILDKYIVKIAHGLNMNMLIGNLPQIKIKRHEIIKNLIDLVNVQFETFKILNTQEKKERLEIASKKYRISNTLSQYFLFELKNDIFIYSSKDKDKYKKPKINNIMLYIMILLLNNLTPSIINFYPYDKQLNYYVFDKIGFNLFDNILIRINSANDFTLIKNYKL
jgi:hypothetical protein